MNKEEYNKKRLELEKNIDFLEKKLEKGLRFEGDSKEYLKSAEYYDMESIQRKALLLNPLMDQIKSSEETLSGMKKNQLLKSNDELYDSILKIEKDIEEKNLELEKAFSDFKESTIMDSTRLENLALELRGLKSAKEEIIGNLKQLEKEPEKTKKTKKIEELEEKNQTLINLRERLLKDDEAELINFEAIDEDKEQLEIYKEELETLNENYEEIVEPIMSVDDSGIENTEGTGNISQSQLDENNVSTAAELEEAVKLKEETKANNTQDIDLSGLADEYKESIAELIKNLKISDENKGFLSKAKIKLQRTAKDVKAFFKKLIDEIDNYEDETKAVSETEKVENNYTYTKEETESLVKEALEANEETPTVDSTSSLEEAKKIEKELEEILKENTEVDPIDKKVAEVLSDVQGTLKTEVNEILDEKPKETNRIVKVIKTTGEHANNLINNSKEKVSEFINKMYPERQSIEDARQIDGAEKPVISEILDNKVEQVQDTVKQVSQKSKEQIKRTNQKNIEITW